MTDGLTASDVALLSGNNGNNNNSGWGGDWIALIVLFFLFSMFGWGGFGGWGGGFGNGGGGAMQGYATQADLQRGFDTQNIVSKLDGITNGICDSTYAVTNAVNNLGMNVMQGFSQAELSRCNSQAAIMQQLTTMMFNAQQCCCDELRAIDGVNYNMATNTCNITNTMNNNTRDIIDSQNAGTRAILDYLCNEKISSLQAENQSLRLSASQDRQSALLTTAMSNQTQQLLSTLNPTPVPAYPAASPAGLGNWSPQVLANGYSYNNCGCNC